MLQEKLQAFAISRETAGKLKGGQNTGPRPLCGSGPKPPVLNVIDPVTGQIVDLSLGLPTDTSYFIVNGTKVSYGNLSSYLAQFNG
jgi:hypothetical protein